MHLFPHVATMKDGEKTRMRTRSKHILLTETEGKVFNQIADLLGVTVSEWMRRVLRLEANRLMRKEGLREPFVDG